MFWKYIFPIILCFVFTLLIRKFVEFEVEYKKWKRPPRLLVLIVIALGFVPIFNYFVALLEVILFIMILVTDGEDSFRIRELKDTKLNNWLFKS
jgi:hypothetical protein